ncbi:MAG: hypothetical protein CVV58_04230 [Tenericutes bacterium HGW-Tenericutes-3]|nr:MAG: hypothetical protein CVV58_04230 [Tenericutes bacterium HGW-Tenericutes-3]
MRINLNSKNFIELNLCSNTKKDLVLVLPGGGYLYTSDREAEPVAIKFRNKGYHTGIYYYRESLLLYPDVVLEAKEVIELLKKNDLVNRIFLIGFSAGGHLAGIMMTSFSQDIKGTILAYPVVTSDPLYGHLGSFDNLLGHLRSDDLIQKASIEKQVHQKVNPVFIMHTMDDQSVPVENTLVLIDALNKCHVPVEAHLYPFGRHGLSVVTKEVCFDDMEETDFINKYGYLASWIDLAIDFIGRIK